MVTSLPLKFSVDADLFAEGQMSSEKDVALFREARGICDRELRSMSEVNELREELRVAFEKYPDTENAQELLEAIEEELQEITEDIQFLDSERGRFVAESTSYVKQLYKTLRLDGEFDNVYAGTHAKQKAVMVTGTVPNSTALSRLQELLKSDSPGRQLIVEVKIKDAK